MPLSPETLCYGLHAKGPHESLYPSLWTDLVGGPWPMLFNGSLGPHWDVGPSPHLAHYSTTPSDAVWFPPGGSGVNYGPLNGWGVGAGTGGGYSFGYSGNSTYPIKFKHSPPMSFACLVRWNGTDDAYIFSTDARAAAAPPTAGVLRGIGFYLENADQLAYVWAENGTVALFTCAAQTSVTMPLDQWFTLVYTIKAEPVDTAGNVRIWLNGVEDTALGLTATGKTATHVNLAACPFNATTTASVNGTAGLDFAGSWHWKRALTNEEAIIVGQDLLAPLRLDYSVAFPPARRERLIKIA